MKVEIGNFRRWFGPYQLAEVLCFWVKEVPDEWGVDSKPDWVHKFGEWLAHGSVKPDASPSSPISTILNQDRPLTPLYKFLNWIHKRKQRRVRIHIDRWDTWSMDHTLGLIILPMLKQLKEQSHSSGYVDDEDVPQHLRSTSATPLTEKEKNHGYTDDLFFKRWDWVIDEMIFAFETKAGSLQDWEDQFHTGTHDWISKATSFDKDNKPTLYSIEKGPNNTAQVDIDAKTEYNKRIKNGFRLFGKYYESLWS